MIGFLVFLAGFRHIIKQARPAWSSSHWSWWVTFASGLRPLIRPLTHGGQAALRAHRYMFQ